MTVSQHNVLAKMLENKVVLQGGVFFRDHEITYLGGIKQCKCMVNNLRHFPLVVRCLGLVSYNDPCVVV